MTAIDNHIELIPKAELHVHVEGTLEPELKFRLEMASEYRDWILGVQAFVEAG